MIEYKSGQLSKKEELQVEKIISSIIDIYSDFYLTKENLRLYIKENIHLLFDCLKQGDKIVYNEEDGIIIVTGYSDKAPRKYLKILAKNDKSAERLLTVMLWNVEENLYIKLKRNNPLIKVLQSLDDYKENKFKFRIKGYRGNEILLIKKSYKDFNKKDKGE